jgi:hypothetical protein
MKRRGGLAPVGLFGRRRSPLRATLENRGRARGLAPDEGTEELVSQLAGLNFAGDALTYATGS